MTGWIIGGAVWAAVATGLALVVGRVIWLADCCPHPEAGDL